MNEKKQLLFLHGGGPDAYQEDKTLADGLRDALGTGYCVHYPQMWGEDGGKYKAWKAKITEDLDTLGDNVILVGHSFGASVLLKYLSEETLNKPAVGLFLIAAPFWGLEDWEVAEYRLRKDFASHLPASLPIFLYHSRDDEVVPFEHLAHYAQNLPQGAVRELDGRGHQFQGDLSEVAKDMRSLEP